MDGDLGPDQLEAEFPGWWVWQGSDDGLWYGRQPVSEALICGETAAGLRDAICQYLAQADTGADVEKAPPAAGAGG